MTLQTLSFGFGALLLLAGLLGGGIEIRELKIPRISPPIRVASMVLGVIFLGLAFIIIPEVDNGSVRMSDIDWDTDRHGRDIGGGGIPLNKEDPKLCLEKCRDTTQCMAWAYQLRNGKPYCWLKHAVPPPKKRVGFSSGTKIIIKNTQ